MNDSSIPIVEPTVDYTKVPPIHQKRTVSFINHFVVNTVSFLNKFALNCEERLFEFENKLQRVEAALVILESRLASIPGLDSNLLEKPDELKTCDPKNIETDSKPQTVEPENREVPVDIDEPDKIIEEAKIQAEPEVPSPELQSINKHPLYEKYFKLVNLGVPKPAVKLKMTQEGLDPSLLDDPQRQVPKAVPDAPQTE
ncbi:WASH complex subunit CCDC53 [Fopius arisanus]|uniref:WASH complex subunit CCDC53 n=1 Tax=Fopius arisanus TaxID=64838 RepID=A0A9R1U5C2_9HYME|nr:PREDICTED: WASH complex subunit CCDC53 [Fopius arisanus]